MNRALQFFFIFAVSAVSLGVAAGVGMMARDAMACNRTDARADSFLAYCNAFGDYEHGVFFYGLEPPSVENLKQADVLLLGNSRLQFAFSNPPTDAFFAGRRLKYYMLGFGYTEMSHLPAELVRRYGLKPKAIVINADPFFSDMESEPTKAMFGYGSLITEIEYVLKGRAIALSSGFCTILPAVCTNASPALFRSKTTGQWFVDGYATAGRIPVPRTPPPVPSAVLEDAARVAKDFLAQIDIDPACIVLTWVPTNMTDSPNIAIPLAQRLGMRAITIGMPDLTTSDGSHLTHDSAMRWSDIFFAQLPKELSGCPAFSGPAPR